MWGGSKIPSWLKDQLPTHSTKRLAFEHDSPFGMYVGTGSTSCKSERIWTTRVEHLYSKGSGGKPCWGCECALHALPCSAMQNSLQNHRMPVISS